MKMKISKVVYNNYRQFKNQTLNLEVCQNHDIHIVIGTNGAGKTNLLNGINWCLYNEEPHLGSESKALPIVNLMTLDETCIGSNCPVSVEIWCDTDNGIVTFKRIASYRKCEENNKVFALSNEFSVVTQIENQGTKFYEGEDALKRLNNFVPLSIREYFFFDGERLDEYFVKETGSKIKDSIYEISQIKLLSNVKNKLTNIIKDLLRDETRNKPDIDNKRGEYEDAGELVISHTQRLSEIKEQINKSRQIISEANEYLRGMPDIEELEIEREQIIEKLQVTRNRLSTKKDDYFNFIKESKIKINTFRGSIFTLEFINELHNEGKLPPNIDRNFLIDIKNSDLCDICGNELTIASKRRIDELISMLGLPSSVSHELMEIRPQLNRINKEICDFTNSLRRLSSEVETIELERDDYQRSIEQINQRLEGFKDREKIISKHKEREQHNKILEENLRQEGITQKALDDAKKDLDKKKKELDKAIKRSGTIEKSTAQREFAEIVRNKSESIEENLLNEVRERIQNTTDEIFKSLIWKKNTFKKVILDDDYSLSLIHIDGYECLGSCGAAERALFALSLTLAIHKESGFTSPLIIDTPIARISGRNRENFAKVLGEVSINKQIILFLTHDEYSSSVSDILNPLLCSRHILVSTNNERETIIEKE